MSFCLGARVKYAAPTERSEEFRLLFSVGGLVLESLVAAVLDSPNCTIVTVRMAPVGARSMFDSSMLDIKPLFCVYKTSTCGCRMECRMHYREALIPMNKELLLRTVNSPPAHRCTRH